MAEKMIASRVNMDGRIYAVFDGRGEPGSLGACCLSLLSEQKAEWPMLRQGYESLARVRVKEVACNGFRVRVQHNPGRITSTLAHVGKEEVRARPCFLCAANLPEGQKAVLYRDRYLILPNPMPVFPAHFTVCHRDHRLQAVKGEILTLLGLAEDFGEEWAILYNGPRCGASAPDHLHFQAVPSGMMPVEGEMDANGALATVLISGNTVLRRMAGAGREVLVLDGADATDLAFIFNKLVAALAGGCQRRAHDEHHRAQEKGNLPPRGLPPGKTPARRVFQGRGGAPGREPCGSGNGRGYGDAHGARFRAPRRA